MPYIEKEIEKLYWSIGEVAGALGVETTCIRFWLDEFGLNASIKRSPRGQRKFNAADVALLTEIHRLVKVEEYTHSGARKRLGNRVPQPKVLQSA